MTLRRREFLLGASAAFAAASAGCGRNTPAAGRKPNIIVILVDDLGCGDVGYLGGHDIPTPNIDSLANSGVRFTNGYVSCPICSPSRAGIMTGRYQQRFGHWYNPGRAADTPPQFGLPLTETTLAEALKKKGYATGCVGKWHLGLKPEMRPMRRGFEEFFGFLHVMRHYSDPEATPDNPILRDDNPEPVMEKEYLTKAFTREAVDFIHRHKDEPFFLYLAYNAPHGPLEAPQEYLDRFPDLSEPRRTYAAMVSCLDDGVGRVLDALNKNGLANDTIVFFLSDNGAQLPEEGAASAGSNGPFTGGKSQVFEGGVRVPFIMRWPGRIPAAATYDAPVISLDIFPTCVAAAGGSSSSHAALDGVNLLPYLQQKRPEQPHKMLFWQGMHSAAARAGDYKLVLHKGAQPALFDLTKDEGEKNDIAVKFPDIVEALKKGYSAWEAQLKPPLWPNRGTPRDAD